MKVIFKKKMIKIGNSYGFTVPKAFLDGLFIETNKEYEIQIKEVEQNGKQNGSNSIQ